MNSTASVLPLCIILWAIGKCSGTLRMYNRETCSSWGWGGVAFSFLYVGSLVMHPGFQNTCRFLLNPCSFQTLCWSVQFSHRSRKKDDEARKSTNTQAEGMLAKALNLMMCQSGPLSRGEAFLGPPRFTPGSDRRDSISVAWSWVLSHFCETETISISASQPLLWGYLK